MFIHDKASLRMARMEAATTNGVATTKLKVPGVPGQDEPRVVVGGAAWFDTVTPGDYIHVYIKDDDNLLGQGAGTIVGKYTDTDVPEGNQGWYINQHKGWADAAEIQRLGEIPAGMWIHIIGHKADNSSDTLRVNLKWGKR